MRKYRDHAQLVAIETSRLAEETYDVHLVDFILLASANVKGLPFGRGYLTRTGHFHGSDVREAIKFVEILLGAQYQVGCTCPIPSGRTTISMDVSLVVQRQMVVYDILHIGNVQSASGEIGADKHIGTSALEAKQGSFSVLLFHGTMESTDAEASLVKVLIDTIHSLAIVQKDYAGATAQRTEQMTQCLQFVLLGRT
jgi:hypothetical protein